MTAICLRDNTLHAFGDALPSIEVIAFALSHLNRFTGHVGQYSVAQHCVHASHLVGPEDLRLAALLHDAPEAIYGDLSSPLKGYLGSDRLFQLEQHYHDLIDIEYGVQTRHSAVKDCDLRLLVTEAKAFELPLDYFPPFEPYEYDIVRWSPTIAEQAFLDQFRRLTA
tara:strand:+ start:347 stop:847 length:501 start_codon:yes stop_codon:yes gene_type:complete